MRTPALLLVAVLISSGFPLMMNGAAASGQEGPWWPDPGVGPGGLHDGWNLRVPLRLENPGDASLPAGTPVQVHLDLGQAMIEAGWPGSSAPSSFQLDPGSLRLVAYGPLWQDITDEVPFRAFTGWLDPDQQSEWGKVQVEEFHPRMRPFVTLEWRLEKDLGVSGWDRLSHYYVYFEIEQNYRNEADRKAPAVLSTAEQAGLDSLYWVGSGQTLFGEHPGAGTQAPTLQVISTRDDTTVAVNTYRGLPFPQLDSQPGQENPFNLAQAGDVKRYSLGPDPTQFMVTADEPVIVVTHRGGAATGEFIPSLAGTLAGDRFVVPGLARHVVAIVPPGAGSVNVCISERGGGGETCADMGPTTRNRIRSLGGNEGTDPDRVFDVVTGGEDIMLQYVPTNSAGFAQVPSLQGSPVGTEFLASTTVSSRGGFIVTAPDEPSHVRVRDPTSDSIEREDEFLAPAEPTAITAVDFQLACPGCPPSVGRQETWPMELLRLLPPAVPESETGDFSAHTGVRESDGTAKFASPWGGRHGMDFLVQGGFTLHPFYDRTTASLDGKVVEGSPLDAGAPVAVVRGPDAVTRVTSDKPISITPSDPPNSHARFHSAQPAFLTPEVLPGEYRGYLVDVKPAGGSDPVFVNVLPGETEIVFDVTNLARWNGAPLADTIDFTLTASPTTWGGTAAFEQNSMSLSTSAPTENVLRVNVPDDVPPDSAVTFEVKAVSQGNPNMQAGFTVVIFARQTYGVEAWFGDEGTISGENFRSPRVEVASTHRYPIGIRNTGSGTDSFDLEVAPLEGGWRAKLVKAGTQEEIASIEAVPANGVRYAEVVLEAPEVDSVAQATTVIDISSRSSAAASTTLTLDASLDFEQDLELSAVHRKLTVAPGSSAVFPVTANNVGEGPISLTIGLEGTLPTGWQARLQGGAGPGEVATLTPGQSLTFGVRVEVSEDALAGRLTSLLVTAEGVGEGVTVRDVLGLHVHVGRVSDIHVTAAGGLEAMPDTTIAHSVTVENRGNAGETLRLVPTSLPPGWNLQPAANNFTVPVEAQAVLNFTVDIPAIAPARLEELRLHLVSDSGSAIPVAINVSVQHRLDLQWSPPPSLLLRPGQTVEVALRIANTGNALRELHLEADGPPRWSLDFAPATVEIRPGEDALVVGTVTAERGATLESTSIELRAFDAQGRATTTIPASLDDAVVSVEKVQLVAAKRTDQASFAVVTLHNAGRVPADDVVVRLTAGESVLDAVTFTSIGPNGTVVAPLQWVAADHPAPDTVRWGRLQGDVLLDGRSHVLEVADIDDEGARDAPGPAGIFVYIVLLSAVLLTARRRA